MSAEASGKPAQPGADHSLRSVGIAIAVTLATQSAATMTLVAPSVMAPVVAPDLGVATERVGVFVGLTYLFAMLSGLVTSPLIARYGPIRLCQGAVVALAGALALSSTGSLWLLPLVALLLGTSYGVINPVSSHILARHSPPRMLSMVFSIKQTGVPIGAMLAGTLVPPMLLVLPWQGAVAVMAGALAVLALVFQPLRGSYDVGRDPAAPIRIGGAGALIEAVLRNRPLRALAIASGVFSIIQVALLTYYVSFATIELGYALVTAGLIFASIQVAGVIGRILWGAVADRIIPPRLTLGILGVAIATCGGLTAAVNPAWPTTAVVLAAVLYGATAVAWNGVHFAEVARRAPAGEVGAATGGVQFFTFGGALLGPIGFGFVVSLAGSYGTSFAIFSILPLAIGVSLLRRPS